MFWHTNQHKTSADYSSPWIPAGVRAEIGIALGSTMCTCRVFLYFIHWHCRKMHFVLLKIKVNDGAFGFLWRVWEVRWFSCSLCARCCRWCFSEGGGFRTRGNEQKLMYRKCQLNTRKNFTVSDWALEQIGQGGCQVAESPLLEISKNCLDAILCCVL